MGNQWGTDSSDANSAPNWYTRVGDGVADARPHHPADNDDLAMTDQGWERITSYTDSLGNIRIKREVVVADRKLATTVDTLNVTQLRFGNVASAGSIGAGAGFTFEVIFNQPVAITSGNIDWQFQDGELSPQVTATYLSGNTTNKLTFEATANSTTGVGIELLSELITSGGAGTLSAWNLDTGAARVSPAAVTANQAYSPGGNTSLQSVAAGTLLTV